MFRKIKAMSQFLESIAGISCFGFFVYKWLIIVAVLMTWVNADPHNEIVRFVNKLTRPLWIWCENKLPVMISHFSAYASILVVIFLQIVLPAEIRSIGMFYDGLTDFQGLIFQSGGHLIQGSSIVIQSILYFFIFLLVFWFVLGLINPSLNNPLVRIIHVLSDPIITPIQKYI